jgi:alcohol dehydrogenase class IV
VGDLFEDLSCRSVFLVADSQAYEASGARAALANALHEKHTVIFEDFEPNPQWSDVNKGVDLWKRQPCDVILAVGGGTALDVAKLIGILASQDTPPRHVIDGTASITQNGPPLIAIPTTAGTGSEATHFAVIYLDGKKHSVAHQYILPNFAIVDPQLTYSLPPKQTAHTGLDAFCQAIESLWSIHSTDVSRTYALRALSLAYKHLPTAVNAPSPESRLAMSTASHLAGKAINITKTTAPHALSYIMTSKFGVPHGLAVALTIGPILVYNSQVTEKDVIDPRGVEHVNSVMSALCRSLECGDVHAAHERITNLIRSIHCDTCLSDIGISTASDRQLICDSVDVARLSNNPRMLNRCDLLKILDSIG